MCISTKAPGYKPIESLRSNRRILRCFATKAYVVRQNNHYLFFVANIISNTRTSSFHTEIRFVLEQACEWIIIFG